MSNARADTLYKTIPHKRRPCRDSPLQSGIVVLSGFIGKARLQDGILGHSRKEQYFKSQSPKERLRIECSREVLGTCEDNVAVRMLALARSCPNCAKPNAACNFQDNWTRHTLQIEARQSKPSNLRGQAPLATPTVRSAMDIPAQRQTWCS